jgi:uncharacterized membrane protein YdfJ with MMPL/SSD domain
MSKFSLALHYLLLFSTFGNRNSFVHSFTVTSIGKSIRTSTSYSNLLQARLSLKSDTNDTNDTNNDNHGNQEIPQQKQKQEQTTAPTAPTASSQSSSKTRTRNIRRKNKKNTNPQDIKAKSIAKGRDPLISLNMNLDYLAKTGAAHRAEELLLRIEKLYNEG